LLGKLRIAFRRRGCLVAAGATEVSEVSLQPVSPTALQPPSGNSRGLSVVRGFSICFIVL